MSTPVGRLAGPALDVRNLTITTVIDGREVELVSDVSFTVDRGEALAIVGESGSGKSLTVLATLGLLPPGVTARAGDVFLGGEPIVENGTFTRPEVRGRAVGMIFQDPLTSLNPVYRVRSQLAEALRIGASPRRLRRAEIAARSKELLEAVNLLDTERILRSFPHEISGGQRQRVMTAMAMANRPSLLIADEPTTALDVTIQKEVLDSMESIRAESGSALVLVTHDLGLVAQYADRVLVLYGGSIMEVAPVEPVFADPVHPYTIGLLGSILTADAGTDRAPSIPGQIPPPGDRPHGCPFATRCVVSRERETCWVSPPELRLRGMVEQEHSYACHFPDDAIAYRHEIGIVGHLQEDLNV